MEMLELDDKRAKEIMVSTGIIEVLYQGSAVWIEKLKENNTAIIHHISNNKKEEVQIDSLVENVNNK